MTNEEKKAALDEGEPEEDEEDIEQ